LTQMRLAPDGGPAGWIGEPVDAPVELEALVAVVPRWRQWLGPAISLAVVAAVLVQIGGVDYRRIWAMLPTSPLFWLAFAACYMAQPVSEWLIFRRLWRLPAGGIVPLLRKQVGNEILLGYIGEVYFYGWARRHAEIVAAPFGALKDVTILSAMLGNIVTLAVLVAGWPTLAALPTGLHLRSLIASVGVIVGTSLAALLFRRRLFSLPSAALNAVAALHFARIVAVLILSVAMWHLLLPKVALAAWIMFATLRLLVSRLPLVPNKELVFAGLALLLIGRNSPTAEAMTLIASLFLVAHLAVGATLGVAELVTARRERGL
jgi:hypothetical protein